MGTRRTIRLAVVAAAVGALALPAVTHAAPVTDAFHKPLEDGCQRNIPGLLTYSSPEWVWVNSAQAQNEDNTRQLEGLVRDPHTAGEDLPENHLSYDFDFNVVPDPSYTYLAGGSPAANGGKGSGNWDHSVPDEYGTLHREWESAAYISTKGTGAHAEEKCSHDLKPPAGQPFQGPAFTACVHDTSNEYQSLSGKTFSFVVAAPPRPSPHARLRYREIQRIPSHHATERVTPAGDGLHVTISFDKVAAGTLEDFGRSWFVGWEGDRSGTPTHLRWTLESIKVNKSLDPNPSRAQQTGVPPGEYNVYVDINGFWQFVGGRGPTGAVTGGAPTQWIPGLGAVTDGQVFSNINRSVDFFVPPGKPVRLFVDTRECDLPHMDPCALTTELSDGNDAPGDHADTFPSAAAALGEHKLVPSGGDYEMTYRVLRTARALPAGAYVAHVMAVDRAGNIELYTHRTGPHRNYVGFRAP